MDPCKVKIKLLIFFALTLSLAMALERCYQHPLCTVVLSSTATVITLMAAKIIHADPEWIYISKDPCKVKTKLLIFFALTLSLAMALERR